MKTILLTALLCTTLSGAPQVYPQVPCPPQQSYRTPTGAPVRCVPEGWRVVVSGDWAHFIEKNGPGHYCIPRKEYMRIKDIQQYERRLELERKRAVREMKKLGKIIRK